MGMKSDIRLIDDNGLRIDGRLPNQLRPIRMEVGVLERADGSAYIEWGGNKIMAAVYGPHEAYPKHVQEADRAIVRARYSMAPFSVDERKRPGPDRRSIELSKVISEALTSVIFVEKYPRTSIDVYIEVLQADAGTRVAGITVASLALADAGIPMRDLIVGCAAGKVDDVVVLDLNKEEDNYGQADVPMAILPRTGEIALLQMDGDLTYEELTTAMEMAMDAAKKIHEMQVDALKRKYINEEVSDDE